MQSLRQKKIQPFAELEFHDRYGLFQAHFILFHCLYRLRENLHRQNTGSLEINPLNLSITEYESGEEGLVDHDAMAAFYLDYDNLSNTKPEDVVQMLGRFWSGMSNYDRRGEAFGILGLEEGANPSVIRKRYRQLAMEHHPDRGGSKGKLQEINKAADILLGKNRKV